MAKTNQKYNFLAQVISLEKKIETLHITRSSLEKTELLADGSIGDQRSYRQGDKAFESCILLYRWYVHNGHARNKQDENGIKRFFKENLPPACKKRSLGFMKNYTCTRCYCWYAFIRQDFLMYYRYSQKWIDLFNAEPAMIAVETGHYVKGMHNLLECAF